MYPIGTTLKIDCFFYKHVGSYLGNDRVLHNHPIRGEEIVTIERFSEGKKIFAEAGRVADVSMFLRRVQNTLTRAC